MYNRIRKIDSTLTNPPPTRAFGSPQHVGFEYDNASKGLLVALDNPPTKRVAFGGGKDLGSVTGSPALDFSVASVYRLTAGGNLTPTFSNGVIGGDFALELRQDATGSRTVTWPSNVKWPGGTAPTLTTTAAHTDLFGFSFDGTNFLGYTLGLNYTSA